MHSFKKILIAIFSISSCLVGCTNITTVSLKELEDLKSKWQEPKISAWYYMGSKKNFHYFIHHDLPKPNIYRINQNEMKLTDIFTYSNDQKKWRFMAWGIGSNREKNPGAK